MTRAVSGNVLRMVLIVLAASILAFNGYLPAWWLGFAAICLALESFALWFNLRGGRE